MAVLSRVNFTASQRLDLSSLKANDSFLAADFRAITSFFTGSNKSYVIRGLEVVGKSGLTVSFNVPDSLIMSPGDQVSTFYAAPSDATEVQITLPADQPVIYVEGLFVKETDGTVNAAFWDPLSLVGGDASGSEFTAATDLEEKVVLEISVNTVGFTEGSVRLMVAGTSASAILSMEDRRELMFRLGTGGDIPNALNKYDFSPSRAEPVTVGTGVGDATDSPWRAKDAAGALNDKAFKSFKEWADALMTRISEISGSALWYLNSSSVSPVGNISLNQLYFDTIGHNIQPSSNAAFKWQTVSGGLRLVSEGQPVGSSPYVDGLIKWKGNSSGLEWTLGGTFLSSANRSYTNDRFQSGIAADGGNIYLLLEREVQKGSGSPVSWASNAAYPSFVSTKSVSGNLGDFTGIALGDYIRKESEGYSLYYKVNKFSDGTLSGTFDNTSAPNKVADSTIIALELTNISDPSLGITSGASNESLRFFRSHYSNADIFVDTVSGVYQYQDANYYWLGRRQGSLFFLRNYGTMQEGEEVTTLDSTWSKGRQGGGNDLFIKHRNQSVYDPTTGYSLASGSGTLLVLHRQKRNNTVSTPSSGDNSGALLNYTITAPVGLMNNGDTLWVRLSDITGGALSNGSVTNSSDDINNTDVSTNLWEVRPATTTPPRTFDDKDIYLVARKFTFGGIEHLLFFDGSILTANGNWVDNNLVIQSDLYLRNKTQYSIPFIGTTTGLVSEAPTNLFYNPTLNSGTFAAGNLRFYYDSGSNADLIKQVTPRDSRLFEDTTTKQIRLGGIQTDVYIPGSLFVDGPTTSISTANLTVQDKLITVGAGLLVDTSQGAGLEVADRTIQATSGTTTNTSPDVTIVYGSSHGYNIGDVIGFDTDIGIGGIPIGSLSGEYTFAASLGAVGDAMVVNATTIKIRTGVNATSAQTVNYSNPTTFGQSFNKPWYIRITDSSGTFAGRTSWSFGVKGVATDPTLTPVLGFQTVPTADATSMSSTRIPFVGDDNVGAGGSDTTLLFSANFTWNNATNTLTAANVSSDITLYRGVADPDAPAFGYTKIYASSLDNNIYQRTNDGNIALLSNILGNVYHENVTVVASPSGNNQMAPIVTPPQNVTIPFDTRKYVGQGLVATTNGTNSTVVVKKMAHGLTTGDKVTTSAANPIGGIPALNLSVNSATITVLTADTFSYPATASSTSVASGYLTSVTASSQRRYIVGDFELEVYRNGQFLTVGQDYVEVGSAGTQSSIIQILISLSADDIITYRIDANGGQFVRSVGGGGTLALQDAYNNGNTIIGTPGTPVSIINTGNQALALDGYLNFANSVSTGAAPTINNVSVFTQNYSIFQRTYDGNVVPLSNDPGNSYEETVAVVASPSGNNQMAAISTPPQIITIPKDSKRMIGSFLFASTNGTNAVVTVKKISHGLVGSDLVTVRTASTIGGIGPSGLSVTNAAITVIDVNTFSYTATASSTSAATGSLGSVYGFTARPYIVGLRTISVYLNGQFMINGIDFNEIGTDGSASTQLQWLRVLSPDDQVTYRMASNGGSLYVMSTGGAGSGSLQDAYNLGPTISVNPGSPVTISGTGTVLQVNGNVATTGLYL